MKVKGAFSGNVQERDQQAHTKFVSGPETYTAEFTPRTNRLALFDREFTQVQKRITSVREEPAQVAIPSADSMAEAVVRRRVSPGTSYIHSSYSS